VLAHRLDHPAAVLEIYGHGLLDDELFLGLRGLDGLLGVEGVGRADVHDIDVPIGQELVVVIVDS